MSRFLIVPSSMSLLVMSDAVAGSFKPNGWLVQGFNNGSDDVVVRPWVVCAKVNQ